MTHEEQPKDFNESCKQNLANKVNHNEKKLIVKTIVNSLCAILLGMVTSVIVSFIWIGVVSFCNREFFILLFVGAFVIGMVVNKFLEGTTFGCVLGGFLCVCSYWFYVYWMADIGYSYVEDAKWTLALNTLIVGVIGAVLPLESKIKEKRLSRDNF